MVYQWHVARDSKIIQSQMSGSQQQTGHANSSHALPHTALCANASIQTRHGMLYVWRDRESWQRYVPAWVRLCYSKVIKNCPLNCQEIALVFEPQPQ